jgi:methionine aminopeptidase
MNLVEMTGEKFNLDFYLASQNICREVTNHIAKLIAPGISEKEGQSLISEELKKVGVKKFWHPTKFRFGSDTLKNFRELPDESLRLQSGDVFYIDVGPVFEDHEADYGKTFVLPGENKDLQRLHQLTEASIEVWIRTQRKWQETKLTGIGLLNYASDIAKTFDFELNPYMAGHRLGDFPHALFSKEKLFESKIVPSKNLWVLEIHLLDKKTGRASFFEDILA